ncbi:MULTISPECIES: phage protease [unclassified Rhizobium]|uniref:phage protease n=1 Tax=unclassified Rhizobium TaxID=2613769 RepID=UPI00288C0B15|nr:MULTISPECIES: phage protease [unclassified Rhizobium]
MNNTHLTNPLSCLAPETGLADALTGIAVLDAFTADPDAATAETKRGPDWIKVAPRGRFTARDGRSFEIDPELLVSRFKTDGVDLPIDIDHATVKKAMFGDSAPAVGWINQLDARADGLYGKAEWLDEGVRVLTARTHRYISPTLKTDDSGKATWLHSAALVAAPAASMPAVASANLTATTKTETNMLKALAVALGLSEDASEASCLSALSTLKSRVDPAVHQEALDQVKTLTAKIEDGNKAAHKGKVDTLLEDALKAKKISPAQRDSYEALATSQEGFDQVKKLIETLGAGLAASGLDNRKPADQTATLSAEDRDVMKQLGLSEEDYRKANGLTAA